MEQKQKIGRSKGARRVCLWSRQMIDAGFAIGAAIRIETSGQSVRVLPDVNGARKVSRVMNHGNELPVIDLKETKKLNLALLGEIGGEVIVKIEQNLITIKRK